ncbi:MAG: HNH endonuclease [Myxococcota bacterium]
MDPNVQLVEALFAHARAAAALDLRAARFVAWFKRQDLRPLGYASYRVFAAQHVDWCDSWLRALVRLVESPLDKVKAAACRLEIPLRDAVRAPKETCVEDEDAWLASHEPVRCGRAPNPQVDLSGEDLATLHAARELAPPRVHLGWYADEATADRYILREWRRGDPAATMREALAPRQAPAPLTPMPEDDPATPLLGLWREPESLADGLAGLREVMACRRTRVLDVGHLYGRVVAEKAWSYGWRSAGEMARSLGLDLRTLQRARKLVDDLKELPDTQVAVACGEISLDEARKIASVATADSEEDWLGIVQWYTPPDFARLVELADRGEPVRPLAQRVIDSFLDELTLRDRVTFSGIERPLPAPRHQPAHPELLRAAAWFLARAQPAPQRGCGKVKDRGRYRCRNPEDRRPTLRVHAHHVDPRSEGGSDEDRNLVTACMACHLRVLHGGAIRIEDRGDVRIWHYAGGRRVFERLDPP